MRLDVDSCYHLIKDMAYNYETHAFTRFRINAKVHIHTDTFSLFNDDKYIGEILRIN